MYCTRSAAYYTVLQCDLHSRQEKPRMIKNAVEQSVEKFTHDDGGMNASAKLDTFSSHNSTFLGLFRELLNVNCIVLL